ncbi:hypothetical protein ABZT06_42575 [Streptomyces sp. NPDC005483]|uniref:hypothetical protein n=1 Tax=Streptomyces sp. NPDC005483 TaxID=3154882 RepID=UPI0033BC9403
MPAQSLPAAPEPAREAAGTRPEPAAWPPAFPAPSTAPDGSEPSRTEATPPSPEVRTGPAPSRRPPWYTAHGMLGEAEIHGVLGQPPQDAERMTAELVGALRPYLGDEGLATVTRQVTDLLADEDAHQWNEHLDKGRVFEAGGHVVWLRPALSGIRQLTVTAEPAPDGVRTYSVRWSSTMAHHFSAQNVSHSAETFLFALLDVGSAVASAMVLGLPQFSAEAGRVERTDHRHNLIAGHKLFVGDTVAFVGDVRLRIFVDGVERTPPQAGTAAEGAGPEPRRLIVNFPAEFTGGGEPHLDEPGAVPAPERESESASAPVTAPAVRARLRRGGEVLNAADTSEVVSALQRYLLADAGLGPRSVARFTERALEHLSERTVRLRAALLMTSGDHTGTLRVPAPFGNGFTGHLRIRLRPRRAQLVAVTDAVKVRDDLGAGYARSLTEGGSSSVATAVSLSAVGLTSGAGAGANHPRVAGLAPLAVLSGALGRRWQYSATAQTLSHTIFNSTESRARYNALLDAEVQFVPDKGGMPPPLTAPVRSDLAVPWLDGQGAAEFEWRLSGRVVSPYLTDPYLTDEDSGKGKGTADGSARPLPAQPSAEAVPGDTSDAYDVVPPGPLRLPGYDAPDMLRQGGEMGFSSASALPGAELVADFFRDRLAEAYGPARSGADWLRVERALTMRFGRPALEGTAQDLAAGIVEDVPLGDRVFRLAVRGHLLGASAPDRPSPASIDVRAAATTVTVGSRGRHWKVSLSAGGAARLSILAWLKARLGALRTGVSVEGGTQTGFTSGTSAYRRKGNENTSRASVHDIAYELSLRSVDGKARVEELVWLHLPGDLVAELLTPEADTGLRPVVVADRSTTTPAYLRQWPAEDTGLDFTRGTTGLYPTFAGTPHLQFFAANLYHGVLGKPWSRHFAAWPKEILDTFRPSELAARFGHLTSAAGHTVRLPGWDGWSVALTVRLRALRPELIATPGEGVEIEHYLRTLTRRGLATSQKLSLSADLSLGVQAEVGTHGSPAVGSAAAHGGSEAHEEHAVRAVAAGNTGSGGTANGRVVATGHGGAQTRWSRGLEKNTGSIEISRGTYSGSFSTYRTDPVFSLTFEAVKGKTVKSLTRYVRLDGGLDLEVPERRVEDLFAPDRTGSAAPRTPEASTSTPPGGHFRDYAEGRLPRTLGWPEVLDADGVAPEIVRRLRARGVLAAAGRPGTEEQRDLERALLARFHRDELQAGLPALLDQGVHAWLPVSGMLGSTHYLSVRVLIERVDPARSQRPRPDLRLTLRGESVEERHRNLSRGTGWGAGAGVAARGGTHPQQDEEDGARLSAARHGGADLSAGYFAGVVRSGKTTDKKVGIYRASTTKDDTGYEFEHGVGFRIELMLTRELPQAVEAVLGDLPRGVTSLWRTARHFLRGRREPERPVHRPVARRPALLWREDGSAATDLVGGSLRYVVPQHFTTPRDLSRPGPYTSPFARTYGVAPRWEAVEPRPPADAVLDVFHPWDVPAAGAVQRWAKVAAAGRAARPDLTRDEVWAVPGLDATTTEGLTYESATREDQLRPFVADLLKNTYRVPFGHGHVTVGLRITAARPLRDVTEPRMKQRRYEQVDQERESGIERVSGHYLAAGPEGRGPGADDSVLLGRGAGVLDIARETGHGGSAFETEETNREATRTWRHYVFDVTVLLTPSSGSTPLRVDVPEGLYGMLPVSAEGQVSPEVREWLRSLETVDVRQVHKPITGTADGTPPGAESAPSAATAPAAQAVDAAAVARERPWSAQSFEQSRQLLSELPTRVVRHPLSFDLETLTRLTPDRLAELSSLGSRQDVRTAVHQAARRAAASIRRHVASRAPRRVSMANAELILRFPSSGPGLDGRSDDLALWMEMSQVIADLLRHRVRVVLPAGRHNVLEICPQ